MNRRLAFWLILALTLGAASCSDSPTEEEETDETAPAFLAPASLPEFACLPFAVAGDVSDAGGVASVSLFVDGEEIDRQDFACPGAPDSAHFVLTVSEQPRSAPVEVKLRAEDCAGNRDSLIFDEVSFLNAEAVPVIQSWSLEFQDLGDSLVLTPTVSVQHEFSWLEFSLRLDGEEAYAFMGLPGTHTHNSACTVPWGWSEATMLVTSHCGVSAESETLAPPACHGKPRILSPAPGELICAPHLQFPFAVAIETPCDEALAPDAVHLVLDEDIVGSDEDGSDGWRFNLDFIQMQGGPLCFKARAVWPDQVTLDSDEVCVLVDEAFLELLLVSMDPIAQTVTVRAESHCLLGPLWYGWSSPGTPGALFYPGSSGWQEQVEVWFPDWLGTRTLRVNAEDAEHVQWEAEIEVELE